MNCCQETKLDLVLDKRVGDSLTRRSLLRGAATAAGAAVATRATGVRAQQPVRLAFCSQLLCVVPYEVTRAQFARFVKATGYKGEDGCFVWSAGKWTRSHGRNWRDPGYSPGPLQAMIWSLV